MDELVLLLAREKSYVLLNNIDYCSISNTKIKSSDLPKNGKSEVETNDKHSFYSLLEFRTEPTRLMKHEELSDTQYRWKEIYSWMLQVR
jgi:hypothetical protein